MAEIKLPEAWRVDIIEYERGWGSRLDESKFFDNKEEAIQFIKDYNAKNTDSIAPDWYMMANSPIKIS